MISFDRAIDINPRDVEPKLTREDVWRGLVLKAENALPFVPVMKVCEVTERLGPNEFVRRIQVFGDLMLERVKLDPQRSVTFTRLPGAAVMGTIENLIEEHKPGRLVLCFTFRLELAGVRAGSDKENEYALNMKQAYVAAVDKTLEAIRQMKQEGG